MAYSSEEIQSAVELLVRGSIRRPYDTLGTRRTDVSFSDIQEAAAGAFVLQPTSPFYVLTLGCKRIVELVRVEEALLNTLLQLVSSVGRNVAPLEDASSLFNVKAALGALESAVATSVPRDITKIPAYQRFLSNVDSFLSTAGPAVKSGGEIVPTPTEARARLPLLLREVRELHEELVRKAGLLSGAMENYATVNLPALVAKGVVSKARSVMGAHADAFESLSSTERLETVRNVVLDLLTAKASVRTFGSFTGPSSFIALEGTGSPYSDSSHLADLAKLEGLGLGAVVLVDGVNNTLAITPDGGATTTVLLTPSRVAQLEGITPEQDAATPGYYIQAGMNDVLRLQLGVTTYSFPLPVSASLVDLVTAQEVCDAVNALIPTVVVSPDFVLEPVFATIRFIGNLDVTAGSPGTFTIPGGATDFVALGINSGDKVRVASGANAGFFEISSRTTTTLTVTGTFVLQAGAPCEVGSRVQRIRIRATNPAVQIPAKTPIMATSDGDIATAGLATFGFIPEVPVRGTPTTIPALVTELQTKQAVVTATVGYEELEEVQDGVSVPADPLTLSIPGATTLPEEWQVLVVSDGSNIGEYIVERQGTLATDFVLKSPLAVAHVGGVAVDLQVSLAKHRIELESKSPTIDTEVMVAGNSAASLFGLGVSSSTSPWFQLPSLPAALQAGDLLEVYSGDYSLPAASYTITSTDKTLRVIGLTPSIPLGTSWVFTPQPPPFARLRVGHVSNYAAFKLLLDAWLGDATSLPAYFTDLNRYLNPLLSSGNPTAVQVGSALAKVNELVKRLTIAGATATSGDPLLTLEHALTSFSAPAVPAMDALIKTFKEKSSDRALDLLFEGQFSTFFSLTVEETSYAGTMRQDMRELARLDLPVRSSDRQEAHTSRQLGQAQSKDMEFSRDDLSEGLKPDPH